MGLRLISNEQVLFSSVQPPWWTDRPTIIVGAGTSLKGFDLSRLRDLGHIIAINGAMHDLPFADAWLTIDFEFVRNNEPFLQLPGPPLYIALPHSRCVGGRYGARIRRAHYILREQHGGVLSEDPGVLECGGTSGYAGFNYATLKRAPFIALFGFDYDYAGHYCPHRYIWECSNSDWRTWGEMFNPLPTYLKDTKVINASLSSKVKPFRKVSHDIAIKELQEWKKN